MRIFISYSRQDSAFAVRLAHSLHSMGVVTWMDIKDIPAGVKWSTGIQAGLKTCDLMIVIISPASMASQNVEDEWSYFVDEKKPLIPLLWKPAEVHYQLRRIQYIDFFSQDYVLAFRRLCVELQTYGVQCRQPAKSAQSVSDQIANWLWVVHDLSELHGWLLNGMSKEWTVIGLRECYRRAIEFDLSQEILRRMGRLVESVRFYEEKDWTPERRAQFANEVTIVFNLIVQAIQRVDPGYKLTAMAKR
jgi:hypothetical protein